MTHVRFALLALLLVGLPRDARAATCSKDSDCVTCGTGAIGDCPLGSLSTRFCGTGIGCPTNSCCDFPTGKKCTSCGGYACAAAACKTTCSGDGDCSTGYFCTPAHSCISACSSNADCTTGKYCDMATRKCAATRPLGIGCTAAAQCGSGYCIEGVCCESSCGTVCQSCLAANKAGGADGYCGPVKDGFDPKSNCSDAGGCSTDGQCDGKGACRFRPAGTSCGPTTCSSNSVTGKICNGSGVCIDGSGKDCAPYICAASKCSTPCKSDSDCVAGNFCDGGTCKRQLANGSNCAASGDCSSGLCVDGVCCNSACSGRCQACDVEGSRGVCTLVAGVPHGTRAPCEGSGDCGGKCDGTKTDCTYPGATTTCGIACEDLRQTVSTCDGTGRCIAGTATVCPGGFACGEKGCLVDCLKDSECAAGYTCGRDHKCTPQTIAKCSDDQRRSTSTNGTTECAPYVCDTASGGCLQTCTASTQCLDGSICETATGHCVPVAADQSGGGCSYASPADRAAAGLGLLVIAVAARSVRRRRA